jgi:plasmid maintenance system antidote protein VapI
MKRMKRGRPYPPDRERRVLIKTELAKRDMTITELALALGIKLPLVSNIINGVRRSKKTEEKIAAFFGKEPKELFPPRTKGELVRMREEESKRKAS